MSDFELGHVASRVRGRYLLRRADAAEAPLLIAFHGYGEDAASILEAALEIRGVDRWHLAAIQALSRFYRRNGDVVASWMTKQDRELAIEDNLAYVRASRQAIGEAIGSDAPAVFLGFSQGTAMTYRAALDAGSACRGIVALAGDVPAELAEAKGWTAPPVLIGRGTEDEWYNEAKCERDQSLLEGLGSAVETCVFDGGHVWTDVFRRRVTAFLSGL